jgi:hypothetical protein
LGAGQRLTPRQVLLMQQRKASAIERSHRVTHLRCKLVWVYLRLESSRRI